MSSFWYSLLKRPVDEEDDYHHKDYRSEDGEFGLARAGGRMVRLLLKMDVYDNF